MPSTLLPLICTGIVAGSALSAAVLALPLAIWVPVLSWFSLLISFLILVYLRRAIGSHPDRTRVDHLWLALAATKLLFIGMFPLLALLPVELILLWPITQAVRQRGILRDVNLEGADLRYCRVENLTLVNAKFTAADFTGVEFHQVQFRGCSFGKAKLTGKAFGCTFHDCDFAEADLRLAHWIGVDAQGCRFRKANFTEALLVRTDLRGANLEGADLRDTRFHSANGGSSRIQGARIAGALYNAATEWPEDAAPVQSGAIRVDK